MSSSVTVTVSCVCNRVQRIKPHHLLPKDSAGVMTLTPEVPEDMWHIFNVIAVGDRVRASTIRKVCCLCCRALLERSAGVVGLVARRRARSLI